MTFQRKHEVRDIRLYHPLGALIDPMCNLCITHLENYLSDLFIEVHYNGTRVYQCSISSYRALLALIH